MNKAAGELSFEPFFKDEDEFLYHLEGVNPRETLEMLSNDVEYQIPWRTYVYEKEPLIERGFLPNNFMCYRNPVLDLMKKTLSSKYLITKKQAKFAIGAHCLVYPESNQYKVTVEVPSELVFAHFPLRSKIQTMVKVVPNWIYKWTMPLFAWGGGRNGFQLGLIWDSLKEYGEISDELIIQNSIRYSIPDYLLSEALPKCKDNLMVAGIMDVSFCENKLHLLYTDYSDTQKTFIRATLLEVEAAIMSLPKREWEVNRLLDELQKKQVYLENDKNDLQNCINEIYKSNAWKIGKKIASIYRRFIPYRK